MRIPREGPWVLALFGGLLLVLFALVIGPWWFTRHPHHGLTAEQELKAKNDVRTTLVQALGGLAVAGGLAVTYRTYRQNRTEQDRTYKLRQAEQLNDRYTKAVEQLGHEKAPVRLGALHSLERLAQDNLELRPLVVDVLCAYLRMPYTPPDAGRADHRAGGRGRRGRRHESRDRKHEIRPRESGAEYRPRAAGPQNRPGLLADHLRPAGQDAERIERSREELFWPNTSLDLTGAALVDLNFWRVSVIQAQFNEATFHGTAMFEEATFENAWFDGATFQDARFDEATFQAEAVFDWAAFRGQARFDGATFQAKAGFDQVTFQGPAWFNAATFQGPAWFKEATFQDYARFDEARVLNLDDSDIDKLRYWPDGWIVHPDPADPTRGTLAREQMEEPEPPVGPTGR